MTQEEKQIEWFLFRSGWFELISADKFSQVYDSNAIYLNVIFPSLMDDSFKKNEVAILINDGGKLIFIECKSGKVETKDIDQIKVWKETYGGLIAQSILVTKDKLNKDINPSKLIIEKCKELDIKYSSYKEI